MKTQLNIAVSPRKAKNLNYLKKLRAQDQRSIDTMETVIVSDPVRVAQLRKEIAASVARMDAEDRAFGRARFEASVPKLLKPLFRKFGILKKA